MSQRRHARALRQLSDEFTAKRPKTFPARPKVDHEMFRGGGSDASDGAGRVKVANLASTSWPEGSEYESDSGDALTRRQRGCRRLMRGTWTAEKSMANGRQAQTSPKTESGVMGGGDMTMEARRNANVGIGSARTKLDEMSIPVTLSVLFSFYRILYVW